MASGGGQVQLYFSYSNGQAYISEFISNHILTKHLRESGYRMDYYGPGIRIRRAT